MNVFDLAKNKVSNVFDKVKSFYPTQKQGMSFRVGEGLNPSQEASAQSTLANLTQEKNPLQETISGIKSNLGSAYNNIIKPAASSLYEGAKNIKEDITETLKGGQDEIRKITSKVFPSYKISDLSDNERKEIFDKGQIIKDGLILRANKTPDGKIKDDLSAMDFTGVGAVKSVGKNIEKSVAKNIVDPLIQEAKKYDSAEEFWELMGGATNNKLREKGIKGKEQITKFWEDATGKKTQDSYQMSHRPSESGSGYNISDKEGIPSDVYEHPEWYFNMKDETYQESFRALQSIKGKPNAEITIYRASPKKELNEGDWITLSKKYAKQESLSENTPVNSFKVKAKDIQFAGDDLNEFGYFPTKK